MKPLPDDLLQRLLANGKATAAALADGTDQPDHFPVVKFFTPTAYAAWLLTEIDPAQPDIAFGLCDLGLGFPELGSVSLTELRTYRGRFGHRVERDLWFKADHPISVYARASRERERMVTEYGILKLTAAEGGAQ